MSIKYVKITDVNQPDDRWNFKRLMRFVHNVNVYTKLWKNMCKDCVECNNEGLCDVFKPLIDEVVSEDASHITLVESIIALFIYSTDNSYNKTIQYQKLNQDNRRIHHSRYRYDYTEDVEDVIQLMKHVKSWKCDGLLLSLDNSKALNYQYDKNEIIELCSTKVKNGIITFVPIKCISLLLNHPKDVIDINIDLYSDVNFLTCLQQLDKNKFRSH